MASQINLKINKEQRHKNHYGEYVHIWHRDPIYKLNSEPEKKYAERYDRRKFSWSKFFKIHFESVQCLGEKIIEMEWSTMRHILKFKNKRDNYIGMQTEK